MEKEIADWLKQSENDLDTAKYNLRGKKFNAAAFFAQQAAEKALKALFIKKFKKIIKIHDLFILAKRVNAPEEIIELCKKLSPAYIYTRYPDVIYLENIENKAGELIEYSAQIIKWVQKSI